MKQPYTDTFFGARTDKSLRSASHILPLINKLVQPKSVVDVGCGTGTWLAACMDLGVGDVLGLDGSYVNPDMLQIPRERFQAHDLRKKLEIWRRFDLVISLEVAEHLPADCAERFVQTLTSLGPVVLFSAAIPFQGGTHHINEQWQNYWAELFAKQGFIAIDCIRPQIWSNRDVAFYYAQNALVYVLSRELDRYPELAAQRCDSVLPLVHPRLWLRSQDPTRQPFRRVFRALPFAVMSVIGRGIHRLTEK